MIELTIEELRKCQLGILDEVDKFCNSNSIKYSLAYGTLLGAVRHKGYIPWDDDIDIMMLRKDYDNFISNFKSKQYVLINSDNNPNYCHPFAKVYDKRTIIIENINQDIELGVNIDIFPIDNFPNSFKQSKIFLLKKAILNYIHTLKNTKISSNRSIPKNIVLFLSQILLFPLPLNYIAKRIINFSKRYNNTETGYKGIIVVIDTNINERMSSDTFSETVKLVFENNFYPAFKDYNTILRSWYGDYMKLPPLNKQITHHDFKAYWINN